MTPIITATYAAILAVYFVAMSAYVITMRAKTDTLLGPGDNIQMLVAMRRHGNLAEYMPFAILVMALAEALGLSATWLHVAGIALVAGRLIHPITPDLPGPAVLHWSAAGFLLSTARPLLGVPKVCASSSRTWLQDVLSPGGETGR